MSIENEIQALMAKLESSIAERVIRQIEETLDKRIAHAITARIFLPPLSLATGLPPAGPFMAYSTCNATDFVHPRFAEICAMFGTSPTYNRKHWEWVFIIHHLLEAGMLAEGKRGVVFGVGRERLPAFFASQGVEITATDAPLEVQEITGWAKGGQHASSLEPLRWPEGISDEAFDQRVSFRYCDMTAIDDDLTGFDFTWSSCCFEHLGSLEAGMQFVIDSVEKCLKVGGIACHTTEFNLSSNDDTVTSGGTVIYRARDIEELIDRLRQRGHHVEPFAVAPAAHPLDHHVDVPPFNSPDPHMRLRLGEYVATSIGLIVRRGR